MKIKPDANGRYYAELLGVRYDITDKLKDGKYTLKKHGYTLECETDQPKQHERKTKA